MFGYEVRDGLSMEERFHGKSSFFEKEVQLAKEYVIRSDKPEEAEVSCPVCGTHLSKPFFEKWGLRYFICTESWTIFAPSLIQEVKRFEKASALTELRCTPEYQNYTLANRAEAWKSLLNWIEHRLFRYHKKIGEQKALVRGTRYAGLLNLLRQHSMFSCVDVKGSIITPDCYSRDGGYNTLLYLDTIQRRSTPLSYLQQAHGYLSTGGLLFLNTRVGSGFDILTLKGRAETIFPYEHVFLPSVKGLSLLLEKAGFSVLEASTPGMFDMAHVYKQRESLPEDDLFARFLTAEFNNRLYMDFQKILQKHGLSSTVRIVAVKQ